MTRAEFLNDIYHHLYGMTQEQAEQHLTYYAEMLADRMEEGMSEEERRILQLVIQGGDARCAAMEAIDVG